MKEELKKAVKELAGKARSTANAAEAMQWAQAALNATHALRTLKDC